MKKQFLIATALILAVLMAGCGGLNESDEFGEAQYAPNGEELVTVTINVTGNARSLVYGQAQYEANFFEVVFHKGTSSPTMTTRHNWVGNTDGVKITIPSGFEANDSNNKVAIFAGISSNNTLLAVGILSKVNGTTVTATPGGSGCLITNGAVLTFQMAVLTSDVTKDGTNSTFAIMNQGSGDGEITDPTTNIANLPALHIDTVEIPVYQVDRNSPMVTAKYSFGLENSESTSPGGTPLVWSDYMDYVIIRNQDAQMLFFTGIDVDEGISKTSPQPNSGRLYKSATPLNTTNRYVDGDSLTKEPYLTFSTTNSAVGLFLLGISIPVCAINGLKDLGKNPVNWFVRSGYDTNLPDNGDKGTGGGILIGIGKDSTKIPDPTGNVNLGW